VKYADWLVSVPERIKAEPIWKSLMYQKALFLYDLAWEDRGKMMDDARGWKIAAQLIRSAGSISANIRRGRVAAMAKRASTSSAYHLARRARPGDGITVDATCSLRKCSVIV
jgi:hypothetical protein